MSKLRFASKALLIALALIVFHAVMLALIKPCILKRQSACSQASIAQQSISYIDRKHNEWGKGLPPLSTSYISDALKPRHRFQNYEQYIHLQLKKTMNPHLRKLWTSKDWRRKVDVFSHVFQDLMKAQLLKPTDKTLCIAARVGQEVLALREVGVSDSIGVDLVASSPLVIEGDMHRLPFDADTFDFEFSNAFDHALFPAMFASEVERTLKPGGIVALHIAIKRRPDKYSANDLLNIDAFLHLFGSSFKVIHVKDVDAFGLDSEVVLQKRPPLQSTVSTNVKAMGKNICSLSSSKRALIDGVEPLISEEPIKPWLAFKENAKSMKYLTRLINISSYKRYMYIDVGARRYSSSIGSWFEKRYPKQNQTFTIYAVEADRAFAKDYVKHKEVQFLPYAAWVRNETLMFGASLENRAADGHIGMGRIQSRARRHSQSLNVADPEDVLSQSQLAGGKSFSTTTTTTKQEGLQEVQGIDFTEWFRRTVSEDDFVVMKMDIEGTEFDLLAQMRESGAICLVDELFLECHYNRWQRTSPKRTSKYKHTYKECLSLFQTLRQNGVLVHQWW